MIFRNFFLIFRGSPGSTNIQCEEINEKNKIIKLKFYQLRATAFDFKPFGSLNYQDGKYGKLYMGKSG